MIPNPRYPGAPARMADGRLFTDYRANCVLVPQNTEKPWTEHARHTLMQSTGIYTIAADRTMAAQRAGPTTGSCVDTMVPELHKRIYRWDGPMPQSVTLAQSVGIGTGRVYLPGRPDLITADPDSIAAATVPASMLPGTFMAQPALYGSVAAPIATAGRAQNRYSAPYGN